MSLFNLPGRQRGCAIGVEDTVQTENDSPRMVVARNKGRVRNKPDRVGPVGNSVELFQAVFPRNNFTDRLCERLHSYNANDDALS